jgi:hypothetical protein
LQAASILFGAGFTAAVCVSLGALVLGRAERGVAARFVTGAAVLCALVFALCAAHAVYPAVFAAIGAAAIFAAWKRGAFRRETPGAWRIRGVAAWLLLAAFAAFFVLTFFNAMTPEHSADGAEYHLGYVARYLREHGFHRVTTDMYGCLSQGAEMVFLFGFAFGKHSAAPLLHFGFLLALAWQMFAWGRRAGFAVPAACAALLVFASPVVGIDAASAYNDVAVAAVAFTLFCLLHKWEETREPRLLAAIGLVAGFAFAVKYPAWLATPYAIGFVLWKSRGAARAVWLRRAAVVAGCAALLAAPWLIKNWLWMGNPLAPFFNGIFPNPYITLEFETGYRKYLALYDLKSRWQIPMQVTTYGALSGLLGPVFLLAPVGLLALRRREGRRLLFAALVFGAHYFSNIGTRFLIPSLPFAAMAMMLAFGSVRGLAVAVALLHAVISWPTMIPKYADQYAWRMERIPWREALRIKPEEEYLEANRAYYGAVRMLDRLTPPGSVIFSFTGVPEAYTERRVEMAYHSAENKMRGALLYTGFAPESAPCWRLRFGFAPRAIHGIRVVQTNTAGQLWNVHELRIYNRGAELPRSPRWRLTANPYPWGIENAFDNSLATFWLSGDTLKPGQYIEVRFGSAEQADSVLIQAAPSQWGLRVKLEGLDAEGRWFPLAGAPEATTVGRPLGLRKELAAELKRRGVDYVLAFDGEYGADDYQRNAGLWGFRQVGEYKGARLYQLP